MRQSNRATSRHLSTNNLPQAKPGLPVCYRYHLTAAVMSPQTYQLQQCNLLQGGATTKSDKPAVRSLFGSFGKQQVSQIACGVNNCRACCDCKCCGFRAGDCACATEHTSMYMQAAAATCYSKSTTPEMQTTNSADDCCDKVGFHDTTPVCDCVYTSGALCICWSPYARIAGPPTHKNHFSSGSS